MPLMAAGTFVPSAVAGQRRPEMPMRGRTMGSILRPRHELWCNKPKPFGYKHPGGSVPTSEVDIASHDTYVDGVPRETFRYLREHDPVHWTEEPDGGRGFWSLTKYDDVLFASRSTDVFSSRLGIRLEDMDPDELEARRTLMEMDAPDHTRLRRLVSRPFAPKTVNEYEQTIRDIAVEVLD